MQVQTFSHQLPFKKGVDTTTTETSAPSHSRGDRKNPTAGDKGKGVAGNRKTGDEEIEIFHWDEGIWCSRGPESRGAASIVYISSS